MKTFQAAFVACFMAISWLGAGMAARADFGDDPTTVITNPTGAEIHFQLRWGRDAAWQAFRLAPGERQSFSFDDVALTIRFDAVGRVATAELQEGVGYKFRYSDDGQSLGLDEEEFYSN